MSNLHPPLRALPFGACRHYIASLYNHAVQNYKGCLYNWGMYIANREDPTPLTPQAFYLLLALSKGQDSGYGLMKTVAIDTQGLLEVAAGTLYPLLAQLQRLGYIELIAQRAGSGPRGKVNVYRLTDLGRTVLGWELDRFRRALGLAQDRVQ